MPEETCRRRTTACAQGNPLAATGIRSRYVDTFNKTVPGAAAGAAAGGVLPGGIAPRPAIGARYYTQTFVSPPGRLHGLILWLRRLTAPHSSPLRPAAAAVPKPGAFFIPTPGAAAAAADGAAPAQQPQPRPSQFIPGAPQQYAQPYPAAGGALAASAGYEWVAGAASGAPALAAGGPMLLVPGANGAAADPLRALGLPLPAVDDAPVVPVFQEGGPAGGGYAAPGAEGALTEVEL